jgi:hypothetical protein
MILIKLNDSLFINAEWITSMFITPRQSGVQWNIYTKQGSSFTTEPFDSEEDAYKWLEQLKTTPGVYIHTY